MTLTPELLASYRADPNRCWDCGYHIGLQYHRPSCPRINGRVAAQQGMKRTNDAHPNDAAIVDEAIREACRSGREFSANSLRHLTSRIKNPSVIGARIRAAASAKRIRRIGDTPSDSPGTHQHRIGVYVAA